MVWRFILSKLLLKSTHWGPRGTTLAPKNITDIATIEICGLPFYLFPPMMVGTRHNLGTIFPKIAV